MKESSAALRAYADYQAQTPPRSLERLAEGYRRRTDGVPPTRQLSRLKVWSQQHKWQERVRAYDAKVAAEDEERARAQQLKQREDFRRARLGLSAEMQRLGIEAARRNAQRDRIGAYAAVQLITAGADMQRKDLGEPDQRIELGGPDGGPVRFTIGISRPGQSGHVGEGDSHGDTGAGSGAESG